MAGHANEIQRIRRGVTFVSSGNLIRTGGGLASAAAGILLLLDHLLDLGADPEYGTVLGGSLVLTAHLTLVFGLVAIWAAQAERAGPLESLGMVFGVAGTALVCGVVLVEIAGASGAEVDSVLASGLPAALALLAGLAFLIGLILFGAAMMRAGVFPRWAGLLLIAGDVVFGLGSFAGSAAAVFEILGAAITCAALVWLGASLLSGSGATPSRASRPV
jgi:hypothetical protein